MVKSKMLYACAVVALFTLVPMNALGAGLSPVGPITNGAFEAPVVPVAVSDALTGSALDTCIGLGHQVLYGSDSWQQDVENGNPDGAAQRFEDDPKGEATRTAGYDHCVSSGSNGYDLVWLSPVAPTKKPVQWSLDANNPGVEFGYDLDSDPFDREAVFRPDVGNTHNLWQAYPSPFQAFTADFDALALTIEDGTIPDNAQIRISLSAVPAAAVNGRLVYYIDCTLVFDGSVLKAALGTDGQVAADPVDAAFSGNGDCPATAAEWNGATDDAKRDVLAQTRIIQFSFWSWNTGTEAVVVDDVQLDGAKTAPEGLIAANT